MTAMADKRIVWGGRIDMVGQPRRQRAVRAVGEPEMPLFSDRKAAPSPGHRLATTPEGASSPWRSEASPALDAEIAAIEAMLAGLAPGSRARPGLELLLRRLRTRQLRQELGR